MDMEKPLIDDPNVMLTIRLIMQGKVSETYFYLNSIVLLRLGFTNLFR